MLVLKVKNLMSSEVIAVREEDDLAYIHDLMYEQNLRHLPVIDEEGMLVGMLSYRDLAGKALYSGSTFSRTEVQKLLRSLTAKDLMTRKIVSVGTDTTLSEAGALMLRHHLGCIPVTEGKALLGVITESDFVRHLTDHEGRGKSNTPSLTILDDESEAQI